MMLQNVIFYCNKRQQTIGGRNPEFGVNHVYMCLLMCYFMLLKFVSVLEVFVFYDNVGLHIFFIK